jgi:hypothetical protein
MTCCGAVSVRRPLSRLRAGAHTGLTVCRLTDLLLQPLPISIRGSRAGLGPRCRSVSGADAPIGRVRIEGAGAAIAYALHVRSSARYSDGSPAASVTLEPMDGIVLQKNRARTPPATIMYATDPPGENALVSVSDRGIEAVLRSVIYTVNRLMSVIVDVRYAPR